jgi:hypothetical protein
VSRLCGEIDEKVQTFLNRPLEGDWPYVAPRLKRHFFSPLEMSLAGSRMTPGNGGHTLAKRRHSQTLGAGEGVKGQSRFAGARSAALEALARTEAP